MDVGDGLNLYWSKGLEKSIGRLVKGNAGNLSPIDGSDVGSFSAYLLQLMYIIRIACVCILRVAEIKNSVLIKVLTEIATNPKRRKVPINERPANVH